MTNFIQDGKTVTVAAPQGGVTSGALVVIGSLIGVACATAAAGVDVALATEGVFSLPKAAEEIAVGNLLYSDSGTLTKTPGTDSKPLVGVAVSAVGTNAGTVHCKLGVHGITGPSA